MPAASVTMPRSVPAAVALVVAALGVGLGFALPPLARGVRGLLEQTPLPVHGAVNLLADLSWQWSVPILSGLGVVGGAVLAMITVHEALRLDVADDHLEHHREKVEGWVERGDVDSVHLDGKELVLLGPGGAPRLRLDVDDLAGGAVREAFVARGWPWRDDDPYDGSFGAWLDGRPGFTDAEAVLLRRRLDDRKDAGAVLVVDRELAAHGLAARVRDGRLQVRRVETTPTPGATDAQK